MIYVSKIIWIKKIIELHLLLPTIFVVVACGLNTTCNRSVFVTSKENYTLSGIVETCDTCKEKELTMKTKIIIYHSI